MSRFIVMSANAPMPASVKAPYRRVAVLEVDLPEGVLPKMISDRAKGVVRIIETWERCHARGEHSAFRRAMVEAEALAAFYNGARS
jgi:hypothetical protein